MRTENETATRREIARAYLSQSPHLRESLRIGAGHAIEPHAIGKGEHNDNYWFEHPETGRKLVLRINYSSQMGLHDQVGYEYNALKALEACPRTPRALFSDNARDVIDFGALVEEFLEGEPADYHCDDDLDVCALVLADVHGTPVPDGCPIARPNDPLAAQIATCTAFFDAYCASPFRDETVVTYVNSFLRDARRAAADAPFDARFANHIQNTEAVPSHFLIVREGAATPNKAYMVDWEKPVIGEVAQDLAYFLSPTTTIWDTDVIFTGDQRERLVEIYWNAVGPRFGRGNFAERFDAYVKANCLIGITWSCNAWVEYHDPDRPLKNPATFELLKTYLSEEFLEQCRVICF